MRALWPEWPRLQRRIAEAREKMLFLDFDGTLVSIEATPDRVRFERRTAALLARLARRPGWKIAIISGRGLKDLRSKMAVPGAVLVGNHGLEMRGASPPREAKKAAGSRAALERILRKMRSDFGYLPGVMLEDKGLTASVHYRNLPREQDALFEEIIRFFRQSADGKKFVWRRGKKVWEIVPRVRWHKGFAACHLMKGRRRALPLVLGDDRTDEDMFKAMRRFGITVRVGRTRNSNADYFIKSQREVDSFLEELERC